MKPARVKAHPYTEGRYTKACGTLTGHGIVCSQAVNHRSHQPLWWRVLNPKRGWRG